MITNNDITYYSKRLDETTRLEVWDRYIFKDIWEFGRHSSTENAGFSNSNAIDVRIPMSKVQDKNLFKIGDIIAIGKQKRIEKQSDLNGIEFYAVTSVTVNDFGNSPHIHLGGR